LVEYVLEFALDLASRRVHRHEHFSCHLLESILQPAKRAVHRLTKRIANLFKRTQQILIGRRNGASTVLYRVRYTVLYRVSNLICQRASKLLNVLRPGILSSQCRLAGNLRLLEIIQYLLNRIRDATQHRTSLPRNGNNSIINAVDRRGHESKQFSSRLTEITSRSVKLLKDLARYGTEFAGERATHFREQI